MTSSYLLRRKIVDFFHTLARIIAYLFIIAVIVIAELVIFYLGSLYLPGVSIYVIAAIITLVIIFGYGYFKSPIDSFTKVTFLRGSYDDEELLKNLHSVTNSEMNIKLLEKKIADLIIHNLNAVTADFVLVSDFVSRPISSLDPSASNTSKYAPLEKMLHHVDRILVYEELTDPVHQEIFKSLAVSIVVPLKVADEDIGLLVLGPKNHHKIYTSKDLQFLNRFSPIVALALKNADSYRKIQEFSRTLEAKVIERTHQLEESQAAQLKLKDEFVFIATHDLATPVTAISGFAQLINMRKEPLSPELRNDLQAINEATNRLKVLVNDLLQVARSESGTVKIDLVEVDVAKLIESSVRQASLVAKEKNVTVTTSLGPVNTIKADPKKLAEVIENIISNGVKYNRVGGSLTITSAPKDDGVVFEFRDTGLGIPSSEQSKVFTKFFRSEKPEAHQHPGTGLGLFVARMLTEKMGGKISFQSKEDVGTTFTLFFKR